MVRRVRSSGSGKGATRAMEPSRSANKGGEENNGVERGFIIIGASSFLPKIGL